MQEPFAHHMAPACVLLGQLFPGANLYPLLCHRLVAPLTQLAHQVSPERASKFCKSPLSQLWPWGGQEGLAQESFKVPGRLPLPAVCQARLL